MPEHKERPVRSEGTRQLAEETQSRVGSGLASLPPSVGVGTSF